MKLIEHTFDTQIELYLGATRSLQEEKGWLEKEAAQPLDRCADLRFGLLERAECTLGMHPLLQPATPSARKTS